MENARLKKFSAIGLWSALSLLGLYMLMHAWVAEDAYITFRVVDNFVNGYGLRWNIYERVQAYTHPLWMLLHLAPYAIFGNIFYVTIGLSLLCSLAAVLLTLRTNHSTALYAAGAFMLPFALCKTLMDYTGSGLENPLGYALYALFGYVLVKHYHHPRFWLYLSLSVALSLFNRLDTILLFAPTLAYIVWSRRTDIRWKRIMLGALPLIGWFAFALFYYGFALPNTKYAKLHTDLDLSLYLSQGFRYANYLLTLDLPGAFLLLSSLAFIALPKQFGISLLPAARLAQCLALGIYCYCLYVFYIGGDYMAGRFWALPIFASLWLWYLFCASKQRPDYVFALICIMLVTHFSSPMLRDINKSCDNCIPLGGRVTDAHHTFRKNRLFSSFAPITLRSEPEYKFVKTGKKLALRHPPVKKLRYIGLTGFYAGPDVKLIDTLGLADPLLARLPAAKEQSFYIGHFRRDIPGGYMYAVGTGDLSQMSAPLADYYEKLRLITAGDLWDSERIETIFLFNLGFYDHYKQSYLGTPRF